VVIAFEPVRRLICGASKFGLRAWVTGDFVVLASSSAVVFGDRDIGAGRRQAAGMRHMSLAGPGSGEPSEEELRKWQQRAGPPDNELPVAAPLSVVLARSDDVALAIAGVQVFSTGVTFDLAVRCRVRLPGVRGMRCTS
jgi:hypothetical protein